VLDKNLVKKNLDGVGGGGRHRNCRQVYLYFEDVLSTKRGIGIIRNFKDKIALTKFKIIKDVLLRMKETCTKAM